MPKSSSLLAKLPFAPIVAIAFGAVAAILVMAAPDWRFEAAVVASGLSSILPAANPPLGDTARLLCAVVTGLGTAAVLWALLSLTSHITKAKLLARSPKARGVRLDTVVTPAQHRAPIFAGQELGAPFMSQEAMNVARSELILEESIDQQVDQVALVQETHRSPVSSRKVVAAPSFETDAPEIFVAISEPAPETPSIPETVQDVVPLPRIGNQTEAGSIAGLMARLDAALSQRAARNAIGTPISGGDIAALRRALGAGR